MELSAATAAGSRRRCAGTARLRAASARGPHDVRRERQQERREEDEPDPDGDERAGADEVAEDPDREAGEHHDDEGPRVGPEVGLRLVEERRVEEGRRHGRRPIMHASMAGPSSVADIDSGLRAVGYLPSDATALVSYLAAKLGKPVLVEGPAGVGKTELAKALARYLGRELVRLQCYEGLDEAKALYEWNYRKQLLRIQAEGGDAGWDEVQGDIFGEEFLLRRPLMTAIASVDPVVLLIDEIDKTDQEFEAMLLELLSDFQISIPELGVIEARTQPVVLLTSNNTRELTEALKRRCLYPWLDYPSLEHELRIVKLHTPELSDTVARKLVEIVQMVRDLDLKKPPSIAESIDWARAVLLLGADDIDTDLFNETMSIIVKHRTDLDIVAERVGVQLGGLAGATGSASTG